MLKRRDKIVKKKNKAEINQSTSTSERARKDCPLYNKNVAFLICEKGQPLDITPHTILLVVYREVIILF
jgi:hypothetical protein